MGGGTLSASSDLFFIMQFSPPARLLQIRYDNTMESHWKELPYFDCVGQSYICAIGLRIQRLHWYGSTIDMRQISSSGKRPWESSEDGAILLHYIFLPILRAKRPGFDGVRVLKALIDGIPITAQETVISFQSACRSAAGIHEESITPVQGEYVTLASRLTWVVLRMMAAAEASDRDELRMMVQVTRETLSGLETLMEIEEAEERQDFSK